MPRSVDFTNITYNPGSNTSTVTFQVNYMPNQCEHSANTYDCCAQDIKAVLIGLKSAEITAVSSIPNLAASFSAVDSGLNITGLFGQSLAFTLQLTASGEQTIDNLTTGVSYPGDGFRSVSLHSKQRACMPGSVTLIWESRINKSQAKHGGSGLVFWIMRISQE